MNKKLLGSAIAAALGISFSGTVSAVDLNLGTGTTSFMQEMDVDTNGNLQAGAGATGSLNTTVQLGFGFSADNSDIYIRFDLDNGATWSTALTAENLNTTGCSTISLSSGGTTGASHVIFNVTGVEALSQTETITLDLNDTVADTPTNAGNISGVKVINKNAVNVTYGLYTTPVAALASTGALATASGELLDFAPVLGLSGSITAATAEVADDFKLFSTGSINLGTDTLASLGSVTFGVGSTVYTRDLIVATAADAGALASTLLTITGDFTAAASVYLSSDATCATTDFAGTKATDGLSATFPVGLGQGTYYICFTADGDNSMAENVYTASYMSLSDVEAGEIIRNGVELLAPFFTIHPNYIARFYLTNSSSNTVLFTTEVQTDPGLNGQGNPIPACVLKAPYDDCANDTTGTCEIAPNSNKIILGTDLIAGGQRCSATFFAAASDETVHGHLSIRSQLTYDFDSYLMISIGSNSGH